jgi:hypothetical protein
MYNNSIRKFKSDMELDGYFEILIMYMYLQNENDLNLKKKIILFLSYLWFFFQYHIRGRTKTQYFVLNTWYKYWGKDNSVSYIW